MKNKKVKSIIKEVDSTGHRTKGQQSGAGAFGTGRANTRLGTGAATGAAAGAKAKAPAPVTKPVEDDDYDFSSLSFEQQLRCWHKPRCNNTIAS